jgi:UDP-N-acetylglucosamine--N-acetylmuramyl-(pentapeptide) pyrophosphoryl-undecaprenol N-acetylglucosamine transferase
VTVVFAGGGTGGHLYPAIAIADALRERRATIAFVGSADRLEASLVPKAGYALHTIASHSLPPRFSLDLARTIGSNLRGTLQSLRLLAKLRPDLVIATGGYVSFPVVLAARIARLVRRSDARVALFEPNASPGLTNRLVAPLADEVWGAFGDEDGRFRGRYVQTGTPIRPALRRLPPRADAIGRLGLDAECKTLVAMGGSQGARTINDAVAKLVDDRGLPTGWQLLLVTGPDDCDRIARRLANALIEPGRVAIRAYLDDMSDAYAAADLLLTRAGASTLAELAALGKAAILVPFPYATQEHQAANAARLEAAGAAEVLPDSQLEARLRVLLAQTAAPERLRALTENAQRLRSEDPLATILARVDILASRRGKR